MPSEFALIRRHFTRPARHTDLAVGDDAALIRARPGMQLAISTDMLVAGTHFFADTDPEDLGWKTLAVNLSDMAAMGARPRWATLASDHGALPVEVAASVSLQVSTTRFTLPLVFESCMTIVTGAGAARSSGAWAAKVAV